MGSDTSPRRIAIAALEERLATDRSTIWRWYSGTDSTFPQPHYLGRRRFWWQHQIEEWEAKQMARAAPSPVCQSVAQ